MNLSITLYYSIPLVSIRTMPVTNGLLLHISSRHDLCYIVSTGNYDVNTSTTDSATGIDAPLPFR